jgi:hypothetical protein
VEEKPVVVLEPSRVSLRLIKKLNQSYGRHRNRLTLPFRQLPEDVYVLVCNLVEVIFVASPPSSRSLRVVLQFDYVFPQDASHLMNPLCQLIPLKIHSPYCPRHLSPLDQDHPG